MKNKEDHTMSSEKAFRKAASPGGKDMVHVCWYGEAVGHAYIDEQEGLVWGGYDNDSMQSLFGAHLPCRESDGMPWFLANLWPDNDMFSILGHKDQISYITGGLKFPANITISRNAPWDHPVRNDYLLTSLENHIDDHGVFTGRMMRKLPKSLEENELAHELSSLWKNRHVPRYSGKEIKIPMTLHEEGELQSAITSPFTHFLKFPNAGLREGWGVNEWMCMELCAATGLPTAKHALVPLGDNPPPAYMTERFDIDPLTHRGNKRYLIQDFCTLSGMRPLDQLHPDSNKEGKAAGSLEQVAKIVKQYSSSPQDDVENLFKRTLVSIAVADSDMHRKNISMIFEYDADRNELLSGHLAPAYDITSEIHQEEDRHGMVLPMAGKRKAFSRKSLISFGRNIGIDPERAEQIIDHTFEAIAVRAVDIARNLPPEARHSEMCVYTAQRIATIAVEKARHMGVATPDWEPVSRRREPDARRPSLPGALGV